MLVDRNLIVDLIALESKRETGYRHPPLYIVLLSREEAEEKAESCMKNTHVQIELIEERIDSNPWLCVISLCIDVFLIDVRFLSCICFYMLCM